LTSMHELAALYKRQGRHRQAEELYLKVLELRRRVLGDEHARTLQSMRGLADLYKRQGRYEDAHTMHVRAYEGRRRSLGPSHPSTAASLYDLACVSALSGSPAEAVDYLSRAVDVGYPADRQQLLREHDLDSLHGRPEFQAILTRIESEPGVEQRASEATHPDG